MTDQTKEGPFSSEIDVSNAILERYENHITRHLSAMAGQYQDLEAYDALLEQEDALLYRSV